MKNKGSVKMTPIEFPASTNYSAKWGQTLQEFCKKLAGAVRHIENTHKSWRPLILSARGPDLTGFSILARDGWITTLVPCIRP
jgi:hypothetical protein